MPLKIGDIVCMNPKYFRKVDTVRGIITNKIFDGQNVIDWEDGSFGSTDLNTRNEYLLLV